MEKIAPNSTMFIGPPKTSNEAIKMVKQILTIKEEIKKEDKK